MHIGVDVGGTNTDAVLMADDQVLAATKQPTSEDVAAGVLDALQGLRARWAFDPREIRAVAVGTTRFVNAVIQGELCPTAVVRLGYPAGAGIPPLLGWPERLRGAIGDCVFQIRGGHEFDGREIGELGEGDLRRAGQQIRARGVRSAAITSICSPINAEMEARAAGILCEQVPGLRVSRSHEIGRIGLLERENATVLNAACVDLAERTIPATSDALRRAGLDTDVPVFFSQNDGTVMDASYVRRYPVATFAAGATNAMRGAAKLSGLSDCIVVDVGGTTTDVGAVVGGFPRPAQTAVELGGVRTNFRMPDVVSVGLGGGSALELGPDPVIGPESVGCDLARAQVFGGDTVTATDVAVAAGRVVIGDPTKVAHIALDDAHRCLGTIDERIGMLADAVRTSPTPVPVVLVGGGHMLIHELPGFAAPIRPEHAEVANAIGAALGDVGGEVDRIFVDGGIRRAEILAEAQREATGRAVEAGARPASVRIVDIDELPLAYLPGHVVRVRVKAVGALDLGGHEHDRGTTP